MQSDTLHKRLSNFLICFRISHSEDKGYAVLYFFVYEQSNVRNRIYRTVCDVVSRYMFLYKLISHANYVTFQI